MLGGCWQPHLNGRHTLHAHSSSSHNPEHLESYFLSSRLPACLQAVPNAANKLSEADLDALTKRTQDGGTEVVQAKAGKVRPALLGPCYSCPC